MDRGCHEGYSPRFSSRRLEKEVNAAGFDGVITVQARQTLEETRWLLSMAAQNDFIKGVVGWVPLTDSFAYRDLESLAQNPLLCAVRHVVQSESDGFSPKGLQ